MIIVSQDGEGIINFERITNIWISDDTGEYFEINADGELLGNYKTRKRAKEVLEEIIEEYKECNMKTAYNAYIENRVYEMPEE